MRCTGFPVPRRGALVSADAERNPPQGHRRLAPPSALSPPADDNVRPIRAAGRSL